MALFAERSSAWPYAVGKLVSSKPYFFKISSAQSHAFSSTLSSQKRHVFCSLKEEGIQSMASSAKRAPWIPEICRLKAHIHLSKTPFFFFTKTDGSSLHVSCSCPLDNSRRLRCTLPIGMFVKQTTLCSCAPNTVGGTTCYQLCAVEVAVIITAMQ